MWRRAERGKKKSREQWGEIEMTLMFPRVNHWAWWGRRRAASEWQARWTKTLIRHSHTLIRLSIVSPAGIKHISTGGFRPKGDAERILKPPSKLPIRRPSHKCKSTY
jgi:hypothetical protein